MRDERLYVLFGKQYKFGKKFLRISAVLNLLPESVC